MADTEQGATVAAAPVLDTEFLTRSRRGSMVGFAADTDNGTVVISLKDDAEIFKIPIPGQQFTQAIMGLFELNAVRFHVEEEDLILRMGDGSEDGKVHLLLFREGFPLAIQRTISTQEILRAYSFGVGVQNGNFMAKPARKSKHKSEDD